MDNIANILRTELKAAGYNNRKVGVQTGTTGSLTVTIKDASISRSAIEAMAEKHEHYERDNATGEILGGGNTFVFVQYATGIKVASPTALLERG